MTEAEKANEKNQKDRALVLFISLTVVFIVCLVFLLGVENKWLPWVLALDTKEYKTLDPLKWALASLIGAVLYLFSQIANFYPKINEKPDADNQNDFVKSTYWYISTLLRAPILAVVIMWLLTNLSIDLGEASSTDGIGVAVDFSKFPGIVNIGIAFILGFYGRVARKQLDIIAKYLFTRAWALAEMGFDISTATPDVILLKDTYTFKTDPVMDVVWTSNIGTMEADTGTYKAPEDAANHDKEVIIRAHLSSEPSVTQFKQIKLKLFKITGNGTAAPKEIIPLKLETKTEKIGEDQVNLAEATWVCDDGQLEPKKDNIVKGSEANFTAPELASGVSEKTVKITATYELKGKKYESVFEVKVVKS